MSSPSSPVPPSPSGQLNVNSFKFIVIIPAGGCSERFKKRSTSIPLLKSYHSASCGTSRSSPSPPPPSVSKMANGHPPPHHQRQTSVGNSLLMHHYYKTLPTQHRSDEPKQYSIVCHKPLIFHTVSAFLKIKWIDHIVVVGPNTSLDQMEEILAPLAVRQQRRFDVITGAATRHRSIKNGLDFIVLRGLAPDYVIVHDGARPYVEGETLHRLLDGAHQAGAAGVVCKLSSTILATSEEEPMLMASALKRSSYWASEMPQAFGYQLLRDAYEKCTTDDLDTGTECLDLVQRYSATSARLLEVDASHYFKVTYRKDLYAADNILKERRNILLHCDFLDSQAVDYKFIKELKDDLVSNFENVKYFNNSSEMSQTNHFYGTVHVLLHYASSWRVVLDQSVGNYENLVYIVINNDPLPHSTYPDLVGWSRSMRTHREMRNFYLVVVPSRCLADENVRIRSTVVYLCKELPAELSGQAFFM